MAAYRVLIFTLALSLFGSSSVPFVTTSNIFEKGNEDLPRKPKPNGDKKNSGYPPCATNISCYNIWMEEPFCGRGKFQEGELISIKLHVAPCTDNVTDQVSIQWWISQQGQQLSLAGCRGKEVCHIPEKYVDPEKELFITTKIFVAGIEKKINTTLKPSGMKNGQKEENGKRDKSFHADILEDKSISPQEGRLKDQIPNVNVAAQSGMINISENLENIQKPEVIFNLPKIELIPAPPLVQPSKYHKKQSKNISFKLKTKVHSHRRKGKSKQHTVKKFKQFKKKMKGSVSVQEVTTESPETVYHAAVYDNEHDEDLTTQNLSTSSTAVPDFANISMESAHGKKMSNTSFLASFNAFFRNLASSLLQITRGGNLTKTQETQTQAQAQVYSRKVDDQTNTTSPDMDDEEPNLLNFGQIEDTVDSLHHINDETSGPLARHKFYSKLKNDEKVSNEILSSEGLDTVKKKPKLVNQNKNIKKTVKVNIQSYKIKPFEIPKQRFLRLSDYIMKMGGFEVLHDGDKVVSSGIKRKEDGEETYILGSESHPKLDTIHIEVNNRQDGSTQSKNEEKIEKLDVTSTGNKINDDGKASQSHEDAMVDRIKTNVLASLKEKEIEKNIEKKIKKNEKKKNKKKAKKKNQTKENKSSGKGSKVDSTVTKEKNETNSTMTISVDKGVANARKVHLKRKLPTKIRNFSSKISWFSPEQVLEHTETVTKNLAKQRAKLNRQNLNILRKTLKTIMPRRKISSASLRLPVKLKMSNDYPLTFDHNSLKKNEDVYFYKKIDDDIANLMKALGKKKEPVNIDRDLKMALASVEGNIYRTLAKGTSLSAGKAEDLQKRINTATYTAVLKALNMSRSGWFTGDGKIGTFTEWGQWGKCSVKCGRGGFQLRTRNCSIGKCRGNVWDIKQCEKKINCKAKWMSWSAWGPCSRSCDLGYMTQTRVCIAHQSQSKCVGPSVRLKTCKIRSCSKPDYWSDWEAWSPCSVTCATGTQMRRRTCQKKNNGRARAVCDGWSMDRRICIHSSCTGGGGVILDRVKIDKTVALICDKTNNDKNYLVKWKIPSGYHVTPKTKSKRFKVSEKYLVIKHLKDSDRGLYRCTVYDRVSVSTDCRFNPCLHGGQCVMKYDIKDESPPLYYCQCPHGYNGEICADDDSLKGIHIAGIVLVVFLLGVVKVLMVYLCYRFRKSILLKKEQEQDRFRRFKEKIQQQLFPPDPDIEMDSVAKKEEAKTGDFDEKVDSLLQAMREEDMDKVHQHLTLKGLQGNPKLVDKILEICDEEKLAPSFQIEYQDKIVSGAGGADGANVNTSRMKSVKFNSQKADGKQDEFYQSSYTTSNPASSCTLTSTNHNGSDGTGKPFSFFKQTGNTIHCYKHRCGMVMLEENCALDKDMTCKPCKHAMIPVDAAQLTFNACCEEDHGRIRDVINGFVVGYTAGADNDSVKDNGINDTEQENEFDMLRSMDPFVLSETHAVSTPIKGPRPISPQTITRTVTASTAFEQPTASTSFDLSVENFLPPMPDIDANTLFDDSKSLDFQSMEESINQRENTSLEKFIQQSTSLALSDDNYTFSPIEVEEINGFSEEFTPTEESPVVFRSLSDREEDFNVSAYGTRQLMPIIEEPSEDTSEEAEIAQDSFESQIYKSTRDCLADFSSALEAGEETEHTPYLSIIDSLSGSDVDTDHDNMDILETISECADDHETVWESFYQKEMRG